MGIKYIIKRLGADWRANLMLAVEMLVVSVAMWVIVDTLYVQTVRLMQPTGFDIENTFLVEIESVTSDSPDYKASADSTWRADRYEMTERLRRRPEIEAVGLSINSYPYDPSNSGRLVRYITESGDTLSSNTLLRQVSPDFFKVFRYHGANGETPEQLAEILERNPDATMVTSNIFGEKFDAMTLVGKDIEQYLGTYEPTKVSAVLEPIKYIEYDDKRWSRSILQGMDFSEDGLPDWYNEVTVRVKPGMEKDFIENLMADSESQFRVGNHYISNVSSFDRKGRAYTLGRRNATRNKYIVITFLLVNVFLGLLGTFWFRTRQRNSEIALMKAVGATSRNIFVTLIGEGLLLLALITPLAIVIDINLAVMEINEYGIAGHLEWPRLLECAGIVFAVMAVMIVCGVWAPARRAMGVEPAEALHDE